MCSHRKKSGYVNCGCSSKVQSRKSKVKRQGQRPSTSDLRPATSKTEKDVKKEAQKYSNDEVPAHNKLFIATIFGVGLLLYNARGD